MICRSSLAAAFALALSHAPALADDLPQYDPAILAACLAGTEGAAREDCIDAGLTECLAQEADTTVAMMSCLSASLGDWDARLNQTYREAMERARARGTHNALRQSQRDWITHRDQSCEKAAEEAGGGTAAALIIEDCIRQETARQTLVLEAARDAR
ncbi:MAG: lysozyme inhibitor LprI family protein [Paracoccus sp. (in: a-proteobacteria)]|nr:lysozyme inhibitor LprI family protein [Paracoccus sp. (in: a-proteobacteria)]